MSQGFLARGRFTADQFERSLSTTTKVVVGIQWATTTTVVVGIERVTTTTVVVGIKWVKENYSIDYEATSASSVGFSCLWLIQEKQYFLAELEPC